MIMWLEGTDSACTGAAYAAKQIDFRLEFSTKYTDSEGEHIVNEGDSNAYTYKFYDKTREIWTSDRQGTESGVTVAPVMQLYDNTTKRGYLMEPDKYESYNGKRKVSCWKVTAPQSIATNGHDIIFRRVNPYNEDEVWNYWHAGPVAGDGSTVVTDKSLTVYDIALSGGNTVSFTAFADGSPLGTMPGVQAGVSGHDDDPDYKVPEVSCGGLWGNHSVRTLTVYDGLPGQPLKDSVGDLSSVLTIRYNYQYKVGATNTRLAKIEYKASGPEYNSFYYFIMPNVAYANNSYCSFKRYTGFDSGFAINSAEKNPDITFVGYYGKGSRVSGDYFELNKLTGGSATDYSYWGSDMLYVQTNQFVQNYCYTSSSDSDSNKRLLQVHFTAASTEFNDSADRYVYLYYNGNFSPSGGGSGYACVVPNDRAYTKFRVENCSYNGSSKYHITDGITISSASDIPFSDPNTGASYNMKVRYLGQNGLTLTSITARIYLQTTNAAIGDSNNPHCYSFSTSNGEKAQWPGAWMPWVADVDGMKKYYCDVEFSKYNKITFGYWDCTGDNKSQDLYFDFNAVSGIHNGDVWESKNTKTVGQVVWGTDNCTLKYLNDWTSADWPHLTFQS